MALVAKAFQKRVKITFPTSGCVTLSGSTGTACAGGVAPAMAQRAAAPHTWLGNDGTLGTGGVPAL